MYLSAFTICYTRPFNVFVIRSPQNLNSIMAYKNSNETARARHNKEKRCFEKREFTLMNLI